MPHPDPWCPERYARFAAERRLPFDDLVALLEPLPGGRVLDLGRGTGARRRTATRAILFGMWPAHILRR